MMQKLTDRRIVSIAVLDRAASAPLLAQALIAGGLDVIEVTFRTPEAAASIAAIRAAFPEALVGAGTVLTAEQARAAKAAGAQFAVAPGLNETVVRAAQACGLPFFPGVATPSDVEKAMELGCRYLKFFPAEAAGGVPMLQALAGPYAHTGVKFIPTGGIGLKNMASYLALPIVVAVGGSWMAERKLVNEGNWSAITALTAEAVKAAQAVQRSA
jgi:2-dehydro-3-deoxyphosphogluconate aldolase/(4S)-4-hydroxy-2-oxoglutarate aldolase